MTVLLPNALLTIRRATPGARTPHGEVLPGDFTAPGEFYDGRTKENADGTWSLGVDPALWPVRKGDLIVDDGGRSWLVQTANLIQNNFDHIVDWVRVSALERVASSTEPGGPEFVGRSG